MKIIAAFAGQGSQFYNMGQYYYETNQTFRDTMDQLDDMMDNTIHIRIRDVMFGKRSGRFDVFDDLLQSSLSIFAFQYAAITMFRKEEIQFDGFIGCSLGEFTAAVLAGVMTKEEAIQVIKDQTLLVEKMVPLGGMIAVIGNAKENLGMIEDSGCELVSANHDQHFVISGDETSIKHALDQLKHNRIPHIKLPTRYGFHSECMECIHDSYLKMIDQYTYQNPSYPLYSCVTTEQMKDIEPNYFFRILREPIRFRETILKVIDQETIIVDLSPDGEIETILKYITPEYQHAYAISSMFKKSFDLNQILENIKKNR